MKKFLIIGLILVIAAASLTVVSANENITFNGVNFTIPDGYVEASVQDQLADTMKIFDHNNGSTIMIIVQDVDIEDFMEGSDDEEYEIGNVTGYIDEEDDSVSFSYAVDDKSVMIFAPDEDTIKTVIQA